MSLPDCAVACLFAASEDRPDDMCDDCYDELMGGGA